MFTAKGKRASSLATTPKAFRRDLIFLFLLFIDDTGIPGHDILELHLFKGTKYALLVFVFLLLEVKIQRSRYAQENAMMIFVNKQKKAVCRVQRKAELKARKIEDSKLLATQKIRMRRQIKSLKERHEKRSRFCHHHRAAEAAAAAGLSVSLTSPPSRPTVTRSTFLAWSLTIMPSQ